MEEAVAKPKVAKLREVLALAMKYRGPRLRLLPIELKNLNYLRMLTSL